MEKAHAAKTATSGKANGGKDEILAQISALTVRVACLEEERKQTRKALCEMLDATEDLIFKMAEEYDLKFPGFPGLSALREAEPHL